jgi:hypothetical protein
MGNREQGLRMALGFRPPPTPTTFLWGTQTHYFYAAGTREQVVPPCSLFPVPRCLLVDLFMKKFLQKPKLQKNISSSRLGRLRDRSDEKSSI